MRKTGRAVSLKPDFRYNAPDATEPIFKTPRLYRPAERNNHPREDAPENLRRFVLQTAVESGLGPSDIRDITMRCS